MGEFSWRMLANVLAVLLGSGSVIFYLAAFFYPEVHRRSDFLWSGLGLFYAVVLWFCAGQMTGAVLLGQMTAVTLLLGLGWQTLTVRREKTPVYQQTPVVLTPEVVGNWAKNKLNQLRIAPAATVPVRLEKRKLGDRLDPRRRTLYDYEFVEDGVGDLEPLLEPSAAAIIEAIAQPPLPAIEPAAEPTDAAPPSADAQILLVEGPEPEPTEPESTDSVQSEVEVGEDGEAVTVSSDGADLTEENDPEDSWVDDWEHEFEESEEVVRSPAPTVPLQTPPKKPSLLAAPLILVGWVKDVLTSFARPKPSKPVIDIPRREPASDPRTGPVSPPQADPTQPAPPPAADSSAQDDIANTPLESLAEQDPEPDDWEESNWDD